jgi:hypothetical protein
VERDNVLGIGGLPGGVGEEEGSCGVADVTPQSLVCVALYFCSM